MKPEHATSSFRTCHERRRRVHPSSFLPAVSALFALQHHADAAIIYSGIQNITISLAGAHKTATQMVPLGASGFALELFRSSINNNPGFVDLVNYHGYLQFAGIGSRTLKRLSAGAAISLGKINFFASEMYLRAIAKNGTNFRGTWPKGQTGMAGLELGNGDLAWVRLEWNTTDSNPAPNTFTAIDWAYDDTPGEAIQAGQTSSAPEPSSTALLALAGAGVAFLRCRRHAEAS